LDGDFEELFGRGGEFTLSLARKLSRRLSTHGVATGTGEDDLEHRIQNLELRIQERDESIRSLNARLDDSWVWGRGITRKGKRRRVLLQKPRGILVAEAGLPRLGRPTEDGVELCAANNS
jgi:uncharacterized coiled-coil protein SlyX